MISWFFFFMNDSIYIYSNISINGFIARLRSLTHIYLITFDCIYSYLWRGNSSNNYTIQGDVNTVRYVGGNSIDSNAVISYILAMTNTFQLYDICTYKHSHIHLNVVQFEGRFKCNYLFSQISIPSNSINAPIP